MYTHIVVHYTCANHIKVTRRFHPLPALGMHIKREQPMARIGLSSGARTSDRHKLERDGDPKPRNRPQATLRVGAS